MGPKDVDGMAISVDPDQTSPPGGQHCLPRHICPKNLGSLRYYGVVLKKNTAHSIIIYK